MKQAYHHRDLRNALIDEALKVLATDGPSALTLRELARRIGVTHAAPYAHFADKAALLKAVGDAGFGQLAERMIRVRDAAADPEAGFRAMAFAYVEFACESPNLYRLMFSDPTLKHSDELELTPEGDRAFEALTAAVTALGPRSEKDVRTLSVVAWALTHGIAMLEIDRHVSTKMLESNTAELLDRSTTLFTAGLRAGAAKPA